MLSVEGLYKSFGRVPVLCGIDLQVAWQKTLCVLGRSGCGKTTLLKCLAGLEQPDAGRIFLEDQDISAMPPQKRDIIYLYQEPLLFPHLDVWENIAFGLRIRKWAPEAIRREVARYLEELDLEAHARRRPDQLSGGQRQRVAFGRALIVQPRVLLLDEPFGALDAQTRQQMQALFREVSRAHRITSLFVTHDLREALTLGDDFAIMEEGYLERFPDRQAFIEDPRSGAHHEFDFWNKIRFHDR